MQVADLRERARRLLAANSVYREALPSIRETRRSHFPRHVRSNVLLGASANHLALADMSSSTWVSRDVEKRRELLARLAILPRRCSRTMPSISASQRLEDEPPTSGAHRARETVRSTESYRELSHLRAREQEATEPDVRRAIMNKIATRWRTSSMTGRSILALRAVLDEFAPIGDARGWKNSTSDGGYAISADTLETDLGLPRNPTARRVLARSAKSKGAPRRLARALESFHSASPPSRRMLRAHGSRSCRRLHAAGGGADLHLLRADGDYDKLLKSRIEPRPPTRPTTACAADKQPACESQKNDAAGLRLRRRGVREAAAEPEITACSSAPNVSP